jgi:hypothetical protein
VKKILFVVLLLSSCYLKPEQMKDARIPANVQAYMVEHGLTVSFRDDCKDQGWLEGKQITVCSQMTRTATEWIITHEVGHAVYENDYCPSQIGGDCEMNRFNDLTVIREEQFAIDFAESWGELYLKELPRHYTEWLCALDRKDGQEILDYYFGNNGDYPQPINIKAGK